MIPLGNRIELFIGTFVGAITFSGSVIAFGKLSGKYKFRLFQGAPVVFKGQHMLNLRWRSRCWPRGWCSSRPSTGRLLRAER
jgi:NAD/NADP transhydrogenase beta subunit